MGTAVTYQEDRDDQSKLQQVGQNLKAMESHFDLKPARQRFQQESLESASSSEECADSVQEEPSTNIVRHRNSPRNDVMQSAPESLTMTAWGSDVDYPSSARLWRPSWSSQKDVDDMSSSDAETAYKVCFVRHGQSIWNKAGKFSGWVDVPLNDTGRDEARKAGQMLLD